MICYDVRVVNHFCNTACRKEAFVLNLLPNGINVLEDNGFTEVIMNSWHQLIRPT